MFKFKKPKIVGIINATPDSFSDGASSQVDLVDKARRFIAEGADIIDIGGESSRPGSRVISAETELQRIIPIITAIRKESDIALSIDTYKPRVMELALSSGANIINDISGGTYSPKMLELAAAQKAPIILMHNFCKAGSYPHAVQTTRPRKDIVTTVYKALERIGKKALEAGIPSENIILDPGIGFSMTPDDAQRLIQGLPLFSKLNYKILLGASRKRFLQNILAADKVPQNNFSLDLATTSISTMAMLAGLDYIRVHNVAMTVNIFSTISSIYKDPAENA